MAYSWDSKLGVSDEIILVKHLEDFRNNLNHIHDNLACISHKGTDRTSAHYGTDRSSPHNVGYHSHHKSYYNGTNRYPDRSSNKVSYYSGDYFSDRSSHHVGNNTSHLPRRDFCAVHWGSHCYSAHRTSHNAGGYNVAYLSAGHYRSFMV